MKNNTQRPSEHEIMLKQYGGLYVRYTTRSNGSIVLEKGTPKNLPWILLDQDNGNPECGHGFLWLFESQEHAMRHLMQHLQNENYTQVTGPFHRSHLTKKFLVMARFNFEKRLYKQYL